MGQNQSRNADVSPVKSLPDTSNDDKRKSAETQEGDDVGLYPTPTGHEYDEIDKLQAELPSMIDAESQQQVDDYIEACDKGKGPVVACFATGEYLSMFERKVGFFANIFDSRCSYPQQFLQTDQ
jgi:hypothetical protein